MKRIFLALLITLLPTVLSANDYAYVLNRYVDEQGLVNYQGLKADRAQLDSFIESLATIKGYQNWDDNQKIAFWCNAYNAITLQVIIDNYPIKPTFPARLKYPANSIRQIPGVWSKLNFNIMGRDLTLDDIEHNILRPQFKEPRIHMAIVCASRGCARLRNEPYAGDKLEQQLADQCRLFFADPDKFRISGGEVGISPYFKWFGQDFIEKYDDPARLKDQPANIRAALNLAMDYTGQADYLLNGTYRVIFQEYDWSLNEQ